MLGLMSERPLLVSAIIEHAAKYHPDTEIVSRTIDGAVHRYTYSAAQRRSKQLARALLRLGIGRGDRVGTLAWNTFRHFELYYGISGIGAVCHTINPRLFDDQITYIVNHAADRLLFVDPSFVPLIERLAPSLPADCRIVLMTEEGGEPAANFRKLACYERLIELEEEDFDWPEFDERTAAALCYTSGTTGNPKGALYSHRSTVLHAFGVSLPDAIPLSARDTACPVVPLFHACGWGTAYTAPMNGAKLVLPGAQLDGQSLHELFEAEGVTISLGVPTVWLGFEAHLSAIGGRCSTLRRIVSGGSAVPPFLIEAFEGRGISVRHAWGMTEMSPLGTSPRSRPSTGPSPPKNVRICRQSRADRCSASRSSSSMRPDGMCRTTDAASARSTSAVPGCAVGTIFRKTRPCAMPSAGSPPAMSGASTRTDTCGSPIGGRT
jgi:3-(methylthio)propionyl---CoA ligase